MFDPNLTSSSSPAFSDEDDMVRVYPVACTVCERPACTDPDCATVLRICAEEDARRAELGLPPFAESTEEQDAALLRDPYAVTCHCGADATHSDEAYGYCEEHAPEGAYEAIF